MSTRKAIAVLIVVSALLTIWGHMHEVGASSPLAPHAIVTTKSWLVFGHWPYLVVEAGGGTRQHWSGLGIGIAASGAVAVVAALVLRRFRRPTAPAPR